MPVYFDFWDKESVLKGLAAVYGVNERLIEEAANTDDPVIYFLEDSKIHPDTYALDDIYIRCQLIGKYIDNLQGIKNFGIVSLPYLLKYDSPLKSFLAENDIEIKIEKKKLIYKGETYNLHEKEKCDICQLNQSECPHRYPSVSCGYYENVSKISSKLYFDHGEIEAFYAAEKEEMLSYSRVTNHPEILDTIEETIENLTGDKIKLGQKWSERTEGFDSLSFYVALSDTTYINGCDKDWQSVMYYDDYLENTYEMIDEYPDLLYANIWLIKTALGIVSGERYFDRCLGIKSNVVIPPESIDIAHNDVCGY